MSFVQQGAKEGLTNGVDQSPTQPKNLNCIHSKQKVASDGGGNANGMALPVMEFQNQGYKIIKTFA